MSHERRWWIFTALAFGFVFLYGPILTLIVYSFNESRLVSVWAGFSVKWYFKLFENDHLLKAAGLSLQIATISATLAVILGTAAAFVLDRFRRFRGRTLFGGMLSAPLVMPEVITGLSLLLLFVGMEQIFGFPEGRGRITIILAHTTFSMAYVAVVVQSRLARFDRSLEEAAMDLGATPAGAFYHVTLPLIAPSLIAGWLLGFTLSLDDLVIASFVSGPGSTTLPMVVFSSVRLGVSPEINALATIIVCVVAVAVLSAGRLLMREQK